MMARTAPVQAHQRGVPNASADSSLPAVKPLWRSCLLGGPCWLACAARLAAQEVGGGSKGAVTGAAGGADAEGANSALERCDQTLGTIGVVEDQSAPWYQHAAQYKLGSTVPVLRMMIQQSNCFVVVERGAAMQNMQMERQLQQSGEMRQGSNFGAGQMVAADYTMSPSIQFSQNTGGMGGALGGLSRSLGVLGAIAGGIKTNEASTTLLMIDNRSGVQLAAAEGTAKNTDFALFGGAYGWAAGGAAGGYTKHTRRQDHHRGLHRQLQPAGQGGAQLPGADGQGRPGHRRRARRAGRQHTSVQAVTARGARLSSAGARFQPAAIQLASSSAPSNGRGSAN